MDIHLNPQLTDGHQRLVIQYIEQPSALSRAEWLDVLRAFDLLRTSLVKHEGQNMTFGAFYERIVDVSYSERFLTELMQQDDVEAAGGGLTVSFSLFLTHRTEFSASLCLLHHASFRRAKTAMAARRAADTCGVG